MGVANIPQLLQVIRTKKSRDLNLKTFILLTLGAMLMEIYGIHLIITFKIGLAFLITNTMSVIILAILLSCIICIKQKERREKEK